MIVVGRFWLSGTILVLGGRLVLGVISTTLVFGWLGCDLYEHRVSSAPSIPRAFQTHDYSPTLEVEYFIHKLTLQILDFPKSFKVPYFPRLFRDVWGMSPSELRKPIMMCFVNWSL